MNDDLLKLTSEIVTAHVSNNPVGSADLPALIANVYTALARTSVPAEPQGQARLSGAVTARKSLSDPSKILSMIDGKPYSTLKRHITRHGYTPDSYREAFGLPASYPMVAEGYRAVRSALSKKLGLGRKKVGAAVEAVEDAGEAVVETARGAGKRLGIAAAKAAAAAHLGGEADQPAPKKRGRRAKAPVETVETATNEPAISEDAPNSTE